MGKKRRTFSAKMKSKIALEALRERLTVSEIAQKFEVHPNQISRWKKEAILGLDEIFEDKRKIRQTQQDHEKLIEQLYQQIGQLQVELNWLKKKFGEP